MLSVSTIAVKKSVVNLTVLPLMEVVLHWGYNFSSISPSFLFLTILLNSQTALFALSWEVARGWDLSVDLPHANPEDLVLWGPHLVWAGSSNRPSSLHGTWDLTALFLLTQMLNWSRGEWCQQMLPGNTRGWCSINVLTSPATDFWAKTGPWASKCVQFYNVEQASSCCYFKSSIFHYF